ncbi:sigma factor-like helix-turn-helix DNA-binding protein [Caulobacter segnis]
MRSQKRAGARDSDWRNINTTVVAGQEVTDRAARRRDSRRTPAPEGPGRGRRGPAGETRQAFQLHKLEGHSHVETARRMGISVSTVEKHISAALKTLTRRLR